ncbi:MAG: archaemetzincin family Zn-dependent metalloprotease [Bacteroidota bacterium]
MTAIEVQPLAEVDAGVFDGLGSALRETFGVAVSIRPRSIPIDRFYDSQRGQYNSTAILHYLDHSAPSTLRTLTTQTGHAVRIVGVTGQDLFIPILTYVFGEAALGGNVAVVSYHRFRNELYGLPSNQQLVQERLQKVVIHELGHSLGLVHCSLHSCVMHAASYVEELDLKGHGFCPYCHNLLKRTKHT